MGQFELEVREGRGRPHGGFQVDEAYKDHHHSIPIHGSSSASVFAMTIWQAQKLIQHLTILQTAEMSFGASGHPHAFFDGKVLGSVISNIYNKHKVFDFMADAVILTA